MNYKEINVLFNTIFMIIIFTLLGIIITVILNSALHGQSKYELFGNSELLDSSRSILYSQLGIKESGFNRGEVEKYQKVVGIPIGSAYCAAGQYWCFYTASINLFNTADSVPIKRTGLANGIYDDAKRRGKKVKYNAKIDDLLVWRKKGTNNGHIERIIELKQKGWVTTIGFNTSAGVGSQSNGDGVYQRRRNLKMPLGRMIVRGLVGFNRI